MLTRVNDDGNVEVLLGKRKGSHGAGKWSFPGGHLEWNESFAECAIRELKEETGLDLSTYEPGFLGVTNDRLEGRHYVTLYLGFWDVKLEQEPANLEPDKCEGWDWFMLPEGLPTALWGPLAAFFEEHMAQLL